MSAYATGGLKNSFLKPTPSKEQNIENDEKVIQSDSSLEGPIEMTTGKVIKRSSSFRKPSTNYFSKSNPRVHFNLSPVYDKEEELKLVVKEDSKGFCY